MYEYSLWILKIMFRYKLCFARLSRDETLLIQSYEHMLKLRQNFRLLIVIFIFNESSLVDPYKLLYLVYCTSILVLYIDIDIDTVDVDLIHRQKQNCDATMF